jgi:hypothetical protein
MGLIIILFAVAVAVVVAWYVTRCGDYPPYQDKLQEVDPNWPFPTDKKP